MSFNEIGNGTLNTKNVAAQTFSASTNPSASPWVRNAAWLPMPATISTDERVDALVAVFPDTTFFAVNVSVSSGLVHIDWGDGTTTDATSATTTNKQYNFSDAGLAGTNKPVTFTDSTDTVGLTAHGFANGTPISFASIVTTTGITENTTYYVVNATTNDFQVAATVGGFALPLTSDGTGTILAYKQALVSITPLTGGATITGFSFPKNSTAGLQNYSQPILDVTIASSATSINLGTASSIFPRMMERCRLLRCNLTSFSTFFGDCTSLQEVEINTSATLTQTPYMFSACRSLRTVPLFNTASVLDMSSMFSNCHALITVPPFDTTSNTSMNSMFSGCYSLTTVPHFKTTAVLDMSAAFSTCYALQEVPLYDTANVTTMASMFASCYSLVSVPLFNTVKVTSMSSMFSTCYSITTVPLFNTAAVTSMANMFAQCLSLVSVPLFNTANVTDMSGMFNTCRALEEVPLFNTVKVTTMASTFAQCASLKTVPLFNTVAVTNFAGMFTTCANLQTVPLFNTSLATSMATMFQNCYVLQTVPAFDTANVTNMSSMFNSCYALESVPLFNTVKVTVMSSMFSNCYALQSAPAFNTAAASGTSVFNGMFNGCSSLNTVGGMAFNQAAIGSSNAYTSMFTGCQSLASINCTSGPRYTFSVSGCRLSAASLDALYTSLPTVTGQTITVTNNWGTSGDNPTIATAKGWTVTGS